MQHCDGSLSSEGAVAAGVRRTEAGRSEQTATAQREEAWQATQPAAKGRNSSRSGGMSTPQFWQRP